MDLLGSHFSESARRAAGSFLSPLTNAIGEQRRLVESLNVVSKVRVEECKHMMIWSKSQTEDIGDVLLKLNLLIRKVSDYEVRFGNQYESFREKIKYLRTKDDSLCEIGRRQVELQQKIIDASKSHFRSAKVKLFQSELDSMKRESGPTATKLQILKRQLIKDAYTIQLNAIIELGRKMQIIGEHGKQLLEHIEHPQSEGAYNGGLKTEDILQSARLTLERWEQFMLVDPQSIVLHAPESSDDDDDEELSELEVDDDDMTETASIRSHLKSKPTIAISKPVDEPSSPSSSKVPETPSTIKSPDTPKPIESPASPKLPERQQSIKSPETPKPVDSPASPKVPDTPTTPKAQEAPASPSVPETASKTTPEVSPKVETDVAATVVTAAAVATSSTVAAAAAQSDDDAAESESESSEDEKEQAEREERLSVELERFHSTTSSLAPKLTLTPSRPAAAVRPPLPPRGSSDWASEATSALEAVHSSDISKIKDDKDLTEDEKLRRIEELAIKKAMELSMIENNPPRREESNDLNLTAEEIRFITGDVAPKRSTKVIKKKPRAPMVVPVDPAEATESQAQAPPKPQRKTPEPPKVQAKEKEPEQEPEQKKTQEKEQETTLTAAKVAPKPRVVRAPQITEAESLPISRQGPKPWMPTEAEESYETASEDEDRHDDDTDEYKDVGTTDDDEPLQKKKPQQPKAKETKPPVHIHEELPSASDIGESLGDDGIPASEVHKAGSLALPKEKPLESMGPDPSEMPLESMGPDGHDLEVPYVPMPRIPSMSRVRSKKIRERQEREQRQATLQMQTAGGAYIGSQVYMGSPELQYLQTTSPQFMHQQVAMSSPSQTPVMQASQSAFPTPQSTYAVQTSYGTYTPQTKYVPGKGKKSKPGSAASSISTASSQMYTGKLNQQQQQQQQQHYQQQHQQQHYQQYQQQHAEYQRQQQQQLQDFFYSADMQQVHEQTQYQKQYEQYQQYQQQFQQMQQQTQPQRTNSTASTMSYSSSMSMGSPMGWHLPGGGVQAPSMLDEEMRQYIDSLRGGTGSGATSPAAASGDSGHLRRPSHDSTTMGTSTPPSPAMSHISLVPVSGPVGAASPAPSHISLIPVDSPVPASARLPEPAPASAPQPQPQSGSGQGLATDDGQYKVEVK
ncbi:hypothetical protein BGZ73_005603 [Actinomortierella ambigua]|nr:hypothetical protein BGZ73_005603 [Actinomortierella ambigua]